ncbi:MAG: gliding motility-associated-like protein [Patiriisocius sp.]|jgi:gliding motility-associated-like protein
MKRIINITSTIILLFFSNVLVGQLTVQENLSAAEMATSITGTGVTILNPEITGAVGSYGGFEAVGISDFGLQQGVLLTTGKASDAIGPNNSANTTTSHSNSLNSDVLELITDSLPTRDAVTLEFDIIPDGDTLKFNFSFASEEYQEFVCTPYDDIFGFFISGPGIVGDPGLGGRRNIALIPGTSTPVTINNVNSGNSTADIPCPPVNQVYHHQNPLSAINFIEYDGWTKDLVAIAGGLEPCETYHLELIIADVNDRLYDSGVFIERIESNNLQVVVNTVGNTETMIEECNNGIIEFCSTEPVASDLILEFLLTGTAINGQDYDLIGDPDPTVPKQVTILAGTSCASINLITIDDGMDEVGEYVDIILLNPICAGLITDSTRAFINDVLEIEITGDNSICSGESVFLSAIGDANTYNWGPAILDFIPSNTVADPIVTMDETATITLTTTLAGCIANDEFIIDVTEFDFDFDFVPDGCSPATCDGSISLNVTGGTDPYSYDWGTGDTTSAITGVCAGSYTISVIDALGCTKRDTVELELGEEMTVLLSATVYQGGFNINCSGFSTGFITSVVSGGVGDYTYLWDDVDASTTPNLSAVQAGTYTVIVTDELGCEVTQTITLTQPPFLIITLVDQMNSNCGANSGSLEVSVSGGTPNYTITWMSGGMVVGSGTMIDNLEAGFYTVNVIDFNGCIEATTFEITEPDVPLSGSSDIENVSCFGADDGSVTVTGIGGYIGDTGSYQYEWQDDLSTNPFRDNLGPGTYIVEITDDNGCSFFLSVTIDDPDAPLTIVILDQQNITCSGSCAFVEVVGQGGTPEYTYQWNTVPTGPNPFSNSSSLEICSPGNYIVEVTDVNGCTATENITISIISAPISINATITNVACDGDNTGAIDVTVNGGVPPYVSYTWTSNCGVGPFFTEDITGLCAGLWTLEVEDAVGCTNTFTLNVIEESDIGLTFVMTPTLCIDDLSGALDITPFGGVGNYMYAWFGPAPFIGGPFDFTDTIAVTQDISNVGKGEYLVAVTDDNGCSYWQEMIVSAPSAIDIVLDDMSNYNGFGVSCNGSCDGFVSVSVSGGTTSPVGDYTFVWQDQTQMFIQTTTGVGGEDIIGLCASQDLNGYELVAIDDNNCIQNAFFEITEPDPIVITFINDTPPSCNGAVDGSVGTIVTGGVPGYLYEWREGSSLALPVISGSPSLDNVPAGEYCLTITDLNDCSQTECITIGQPLPLIVSVSFVDQGGGFGLTCFGDVDGVLLSAVSGGDGNYTYSWSECIGAPFAVGVVTSVSGLSAGTYCLEIEDGQGCIGNATIDLTSPPEISNNAVVENISCAVGNDGSINLNLTGGTGIYPVIDWTPDGFIPDGTQVGTNLPADTYLVDVEDSNGCTASFSFVVNGSEAIDVTLTSPQLLNGFNVSCNGLCDASLTANIVGGSGAPVITWTGPAPVGGTLGNVTSFDGVVCAGVYTVEVVDGVCAGMDEFTVTEPLAIVIDIVELEEISCSGECDGQLQATASGGGGGFTYQWDGGQAAGPITEANLCVGQHCVTVTDVNDCSTTLCYTISEPAPIVLDIVDTPISCNAVCDGELIVDITGGTLNYDIEWTGPDDFTSDQVTITNLCAGLYEVEVTDANNCVQNSTFNLMEPEAIEVNISQSDFNGTGVSCFGTCDGWINVDYLGSGTADFSWAGPNNPPANDSIFDLCEGLYVLTTSTSSGVCTRIDNITITSPDEISFDLIASEFPGGTNISCVGASSGSIEVDNLIGGFGDYEFYWIQDADTIAVDVNEIDGLMAGTYSLVIVDENGCIASESITLTEPTEILSAEITPAVFANGSNTSCYDICDGSIDAEVTNGIGDITYAWIGPNLDGEMEDSVDDLCNGIYVLVVTDENECTATAMDTIIAAETLVIVSSIDSVLCFGTSDGRIEVVVLGGDDLTYDWTGDITSDSTIVDELDTGTYNLTVTDGFGCMVSEEYILLQPDTILVEFIASVFPDIPGDFNLSGPESMDGFIISVVEGGVEPYSYSWNGPPGEMFSTDSAVVNVDGGHYCLVVTDANGCVDGLCIRLKEPDILHMPNGMSPNGDGMNDGLMIEGIELYPENLIKVFNRWGNVVFEQKDYSNDSPWNGEGIGGNFVPDGTYFVLLDITDSAIELHGYLEVRR